MIEEAIVIQETTHLGESASATIAGFVDSIAGNKKGLLFTHAMNAAGYSRNPGRLSAIYAENSSVLNAYFAEIELKNVFGSMTAEEERAFLKSILFHPYFTFCAGLITGLTAFYLWRRHKNGQ